MAISTSPQPSLEFGICSNHGTNKRFRNPKSRGELYLLGTHLSSVSMHSWASNLSRRRHRRVWTIPSKNHQFECRCLLNPGPSSDAMAVKNVVLTLARSFNCLQGNTLVFKVVSAVGILVFAVWGLEPLVRQSRSVFLSKSDSSWKRSSAYHVTMSYIKPLLLWAGAIFVCRALDPMILPSEAGEVVKQRLLNFVRSLSTVLALAHCLSSAIQQAQKFFVETNDPNDNRNMGFQFAGRAVSTAVWVAAVSLFMELSGFSTQRWLTAGGLGTVLLTLAGREIFTNFLSSIIIHATRPFVLSEWIQSRIEGYEVSGTVEHVGWWSPTIIRGDDREAVHIPNHKFTVNVVRNLSQKTHWRIKTHLAISHLDVGKINNIVADMRKVLAKNPQVEQQKLHRRVFLDKINPENQALLILVSCFVKTSRFEEYLCVKEAIILDLVRVITHHRARLATPIRTVQKMSTDADLDGIPFQDSEYARRAASNHPLLLIEPSYKINGDNKTKAGSTSVNGDEESKVAEKSTQSTLDNKVDAIRETTLNTDIKSEETEFSNYNTKEMVVLDAKVGKEFGQKVKVETKEPKSPSGPELSDSATKSKTEPKSVEMSSPDATSSPGLTRNTSDNKHSQTQKDASSTSQLNQDTKQPVAQAAPTKSSLEENIVLGVALEGSKRTLPVEDDIVPPSNPEDTKELAASRSSTGPAVDQKERSEAKRSNAPGISAGDQLGQQHWPSGGSEGKK